MRTPSADRERITAVEAALLRCVDVLLAATLFGVPLAMGGRQALGQFLLVILAIGVGVCWCVRQALSSHRGWTWSWAEILLAAALGLVGLQLVPLPAAWVETLSPRVYELLPLWSPEAAAGAKLGTWSCLSLTPTETWGGWTVLLAYAILFLVTVQRIGELDDVERLLRWMAIAGIGMAAFGLLQYLVGNGKFFWVYEHPFSSTAENVKGSFTNRNHFAHFLVLAVGPLVWWIQRSLTQEPVEHSRRRHHHLPRTPRPMDTSVGFLVAALGLCVFAVLMSLSRGGIVILFVTAAVSLAILYRGALLDGKTIFFLGGAGLLVAVSLGIYGYHLVAARLDALPSLSDLDSFGARRDVWRADVAAARDFRWTGTGIGSHVQVNPMYLPDDDASQYSAFTHAENGYLQVAVEAGLAGLALVLAGIGLLGSWCLALFQPGISRRALLCFVGIVPGLTASLLHSLVDFIWYAPGCMVVVVLLAACACRVAHLVRGRGRPAIVVPAPRVAWMLAAPALVLLGGLMVPGLFGAVLAEPNWYRAMVEWPKLREVNDAACLGELEAVVQDLTQAVSRQPDHALAHASLAEVHLRMFQLTQGPGGLDARQVRDAAVASRFGSRAELDDWLNRAFARSRRHLDEALQHGRRAVSLCPVLGLAYTRLATVTFLDGPNAPGADWCIQQALRLRPFDGTVLFEAGQEAMLVGYADAAYALWQRSFACGSRHQGRLFRVLAPTLPAQLFLEMFPMELPALQRLEAQYRQLKRPDEVKLLVGRRAQLARGRAESLQGEEAVQLWLNAARAHRELGDTEACISCLQQALGEDPSDYDARYLLATCLFSSRRYAEAEEHLNWCRNHKPHDETVRSMLDKALTERLRGERAAGGSSRQRTAGRWPATGERR